MLRSILWCCALLVLTPQLAAAEWHFIPNVGLTFKGKTSLVDLEQATDDVHRNIGGTVTLLGEGVIGLESVFVYTPGFFQSTDDLVTKSRTIAFMGNAVLTTPRRWTEYGLRPFVSGGLGVLRTSVTEVGDIFVDGRTHDVQVWTPARLRHSVSSVEQLLIDTPTRDRVRLGEIAHVRVVPAPNSIKREGGSRRIDVQANVAGRDLSSVAQEVQAALQKVAFPLEYRAVLQGEYVELRAAQNRLLLFSALAGLAILLVLHMAFHSWRLAILNFLILPSALVGGILATALADRVVSLGSLVGFLTVLGIAARNGIMMVNHFQHLERYEGETFGLKLVLRGAGERLRPIMMTALTAGLAILPLVIYGDLPGHEIEYPMAVVILGGLVTSTLLSLFILPALYLRFGRGATALEDDEEDFATVKGHAS